jgi:hypothetical protein
MFRRVKRRLIVLPSQWKWPYIVKCGESGGKERREGAAGRSGGKERREGAEERSRSAGTSS